MRQPLFNYGISLLLALAAAPAFAQVGTVKGKVLDPDGNPVADAVVTVKPAEGRGIAFTTKSKKNGTYLQLTSQTSGPWILAVAREGFEAWQTADPVVVPIGGDPVTIDVKLVRAVPRPDAAQLARAAQFTGATSQLLAADAAAKAGDQAGAREKLAAAAVTFADIVAKEPENAKAHYNLAFVYDRQQDWERAAASYKKAAELDPAMVDASVGATAAYINARQLPKALEIGEAANAAHPGDARIETLLALALYNSARYAEAGVLYEKQRVALPENPEPYYYLGLIALNENRPADSLALLEKFVTMRATANPSYVKNAEDVIAVLEKRTPPTR